MNRFGHRIPAILLASTLGLALPAAAGTTYGASLSELEPVRIAELTASPERYVDRRVKVVGLVDDVCPMKGCWVDIVENGSREMIRLKVQDDVIVFPAEARGSEIVAEGTLRRHELSPSQAVRWLRHLAEERGEVYEEPPEPQPLTSTRSRAAAPWCTSRVLTDEQRQAVIAHMNDDHGDALLLYARVFGGQPQATRAQMTDIDASGISLRVQADGGWRDMTIALPRPVADPASAREVLARMVREARERMALRSR